MINANFGMYLDFFVKNNDSSTTTPPLCSTWPSGDNKFHFTDKEKAECLNDYVASISNVDDQNTALPPFFRKSPNSLSNISCTAEEIELLVQTLNPNKANGLDGISNQMLRAVSKTNI